MDFKSKYLQYKFKYILAKNFSGGMNDTSEAQKYLKKGNISPKTPSSKSPESLFTSPSRLSFIPGPGGHFSHPNADQTSESPQSVNDLFESHTPITTKELRQMRDWANYEKILKKAPKKKSQSSHFRQVPVGVPEPSMDKLVLGLPEKPLKIQNRIKEINALIRNPQIHEALSEEEISELMAEAAELTNKLDEILSTEDFPNIWEDNYEKTVELINEMQRRDRERESAALEAEAVAKAKPAKKKMSSNKKKSKDDVPLDNTTEEFKQQMKAYEQMTTEELVKQMKAYEQMYDSEERNRESGTHDNRDTIGAALYDWVNQDKRDTPPSLNDWVVTPPSPPAERPVKLSDKDSKIIQELFRLKNMKSNTNEQQREKNQQIIDFIDENIHKINNQVKELFHNTRQEIYKEQKELLSKLNQQLLSKLKQLKDVDPSNNAFMQADLNGDGFLSQSEFEAAFPEEKTVTQEKPIALFDSAAVENSMSLSDLMRSDKKPSPPKEDNSSPQLDEETDSVPQLDEEADSDLLASLQRQTPPKEDICKFQPCSVQGGNKKKYGVYKDKLVEIIEKHTDSEKPYYTIKVNDIEKQVDSLSELN